MAVTIVRHRMLCQKRVSKIYNTTWNMLDEEICQSPAPRLDKFAGLLTGFWLACRIEARGEV